VPIVAVAELGPSPELMSRLHRINTELRFARAFPSPGRGSPRQRSEESKTDDYRQWSLAKGFVAGPYL